MVQVFLVLPVRPYQNYLSTIFLCLIAFSLLLLLLKQCFKIHQTNGNEKGEEVTRRIIIQIGKHFISHTLLCWFLTQVATINIPKRSHLDMFFHWAWVDNQVGRYTDSFQRYFYTHVGRCLCFHIHQYLCRKKAEL